MPDPIRIELLNRRDFVVGSGAAAAVASLLGASPSRAQDGSDENNWQAILKKILGNAKPVESKLTLELPEIAENGNVVPFTLALDSPMTAGDYVKALHLISKANPQADVASFFLTPAAGRASVTSRMRLAKTQDVIAVAELSNGSFCIAQRTVKVTIGGCGG